MVGRPASSSQEESNGLNSERTNGFSIEESVDHPRTTEGDHAKHLLGPTRESRKGDGSIDVRIKTSSSRAIDRKKSKNNV